MGGCPKRCGASRTAIPRCTQAVGARTAARRLQASNGLAVAWQREIQSGTPRSWDARVREECDVRATERARRRIVAGSAREVSRRTFRARLQRSQVCSCSAASSMGRPQAATRAPLGGGAGCASVSARAGSCDRGTASSQRKLAAAPRPGHWRHHELAAFATRHAGSRHADSARAAAAALVQKQPRQAVELALAGCGRGGSAGDYRIRSRSAKHADVSLDTSRGCHLEAATKPPRWGRVRPASAAGLEGRCNRQCHRSAKRLPRGL